MIRDVVLLGGPTASGKTALSLHAAERLNGEIVNADAMQVYTGMDIIAASPTPAERDRVPHHLFGILDMADRCSVGRWVEMALNVISDIAGRGRTAILVGGTGLYFKALETGLADVPPVAPERVERLGCEPLDALRKRAEAIDPDATAKIETGDRQRLVRLISVFEETGQTLSAFQTNTVPRLDADRCVGIAVTPDRDGLYSRIERRFDDMIECGALREAEAIYARHLDPGLPAVKAVGLRPLLEHLDGKTDLQTAISLAKRDSRRYAKRQFTWFSNQHPTWAKVRALEPEAQLCELEYVLDAL